MSWNPASRKILNRGFHRWTSLGGTINGESDKRLSRLRRNGKPRTVDGASLSWKFHAPQKSGADLFSRLRRDTSDKKNYSKFRKILNGRLKLTRKVRYAYSPDRVRAAFYYSEDPVEIPTAVTSGQ
jgi:hypothetical protein